MFHVTSATPLNTRTQEMSCEEACPPQYFGIGTADTGRTCQPCANNCDPTSSEVKDLGCLGYTSNGIYILYIRDYCI